MSSPLLGREPPCPGLSSMWVWAGQKVAGMGLARPEARVTSISSIGNRGCKGQNLGTNTDKTVPSPLLQQRKTLHFFQKEKNATGVTIPHPTPLTKWRSSDTQEEKSICRDTLRVQAQRRYEKWQILDTNSSQTFTIL